MQLYPQEAMLLAAGIGQRLRPYTNHLPKPLFPVANRPIIAWNLDWLRQHGVQRVVINTHHLGEQLHRYLGDGKAFGLQITYSDEPTLLGTGGGIVKMLPQIESEAFYCLNADMFNFFDLRRMADGFIDGSGKACMAVTRARSGIREGLIHIKNANEGERVAITGMLQNETSAAQVSLACHFLGVHLFSTEFLRSWSPPDGAFCINRQGYLQWHEMGVPLQAFLTAQPLYDTGDPERLLMVNRAVLERNLSGYPANLDAKIKPPLVVSAKAQIGRHCQIGPNVSIGDEAVIGDDCQLSDCIVFPKTRVAPKGRYRNQLLTPF